MRPLRFGMTRRLERTRPEHGRSYSRVAISNRPLRPDPDAPWRKPLRTRRVVIPEDIPDMRNARFAPNFRHHPWTGGHQTPCHVPITVFVPRGALRETRDVGHFLPFWTGKSRRRAEKRVCYCPPFA